MTDFPATKALLTAVQARDWVEAETHVLAAWAEYEQAYAAACEADADLVGEIASLRAELEHAQARSQKAQQREGAVERVLGILETGGTFDMIDDVAKARLIVQALGFADEVDSTAKLVNEANAQRRYEACVEELRGEGDG